MDGETALGANGGPVTEDEFLMLKMRWDEAQSELTEALAACKAPRKTVKELKDEIGNRMPFEAFERALRDYELPGAVRQDIARVHAQLLAFLGRPIGYQQDFFDERAPGVAALHAIDTEGESAGRAGHHADENPYTPGSESYRRWANAHGRGYEAFVAEQKERAEVLTPEPKRSRGRPRKDGSPAQARTAAE